MKSESPHVSAPFIMTIFGATGDLSQRKLFPSLYHLFQRGVLPEHFYIVGFSRREYDLSEFKLFVKNAVQKYHGHDFEERTWVQFEGKIYYQQGDFDTDLGYRELIEKLKQFDELRRSCVPRFFYLATPPDKYSSIIKFMDLTKLAEGCGQGSDKWTKVMIEKPFGRNIEDATALDKQLASTFREDQIYRIDHYLGKETVQNILAFRFGNTFFDTVWNNKFIAKTEILIAETLGVETRGNFYEGVGALRDMAQSHMLELLAAVTMDQPQSIDAKGIRASRVKSIQQIHCFSEKEVTENTLRGQYGPGVVSGESVVGYRQEARVAIDSNTETFVSLKLAMESARWSGVPFILTTGKRLAQKKTHIKITFKEPILKMFKGEEVSVLPNILEFRIEPNEGITLSLNAKKIGLATQFETVPLNYTYDRGSAFTDAYEKILIDAMRGDQTLFTRTDEVNASWKLITSIADGWWAQGKPDFPNYAAGSWGPKGFER